MTRTTSLQIGELAEQAGVSIRTVRYYEELGLLQPSGWTPGGMRLYSESDVARLRFLRRLRGLRLSLDEIKLALGLEQLPQSREEKVNRTMQVLALELTRAEEEIATLRQLRKEVRETMDKVLKCVTCTTKECPQTCPRLVYLL